MTRARLRSEDGYTLVELLICMVILGIILAPLATSFTSALRSQATIQRREEAQENARTTLQRMEADIHCAGNNTSVDQNAAGGFTLTLSENNHDSPSQAGWCPGVIPYDPAVNPQPDGVQWCTAPVNSSSTRFALYRYFIFSGGDATACGASANATFQVDYIAPPPGGWPDKHQHNHGAHLLGRQHLAIRHTMRRRLRCARRPPHRQSRPQRCA